MRRAIGLAAALALVGCATVPVSAPIAAAPAETGGNRGYDDAAPDMAAVFIADGPAFAHGRRLPGFDNVAVVPLLRDLLGLPPGQGLDGSDAPFKGVLRR